MLLNQVSDWSLVLQDDIAMCTVDVHYIEQNETNYFTSSDPYVDKQITYKGNKLEDLNKRFNEKILEGKLINFFNLPKFFC